MVILNVIVADVIIVYDRLAICYVSIICYYYNKNIIPIKFKIKYPLLVPILFRVPYTDTGIGTYNTAANIGYRRVDCRTYILLITYKYVRTI